MTDLLISDVAARSGFSATTLRYYEQIGLVSPAGRTASGYRLYDERAVERLAFVARAKALGLGLDEIVELAALWDDDRCGPVQDRLRTLLAAKRDELRDRIGELVALAAELDGVARRLGAHTPDGPCDDACGCLAEAPEPTATPPNTTLGRRTGASDAATKSVALTRRRADRGDVPVACTLSASEMPGRLDDWRALLDRARHRTATATGVRVAFPSEPGLAGRVAELARAEQSCCAFFTFTLELDADEIVLDVAAPPDALDVVAALFGTAP